MLSREDRRDLGWLGLLVAVYGLACAPVLHALYGHGGAAPSSATPTARAWVTHQRVGSNEPPPPELPAPHDERTPHSHAPSDKHGKNGRGETPAGHTHGAGSVEHLHAVALPSAALPRMWVSWVETLPLLPGQERPRPGDPLRPTAMPQGP
ncbi:MAG TPA: hypothetical protein VF794_08290 [Archangium sp.]|uniref:hypothetical protein n=1 Tax=Archangium sp. TaxID=1872627 RepID=UPI002EDA9886